MDEETKETMWVGLSTLGAVVSVALITFWILPM